MKTMRGILSEELFTPYFHLVLISAQVIPELQGELLFGFM